MPLSSFWGCLSPPRREGTPPATTCRLRPLTRQAAVEYALSHNRAYRAAFEDVSVASEKVSQAKADFFPKVDGSYAFTQLSNQPFISIVGTSFQKIPFSIKTSNRWQVDLVQPLFTGFGLESQYMASKVGLKISQVPA